MVYVRKLLADFPDDAHRNNNYTQDLIVPRFFPWLVREYNMALRSGHPEAIEAALADMRFLMPMHRPRIRLVLRLLMPILELHGQARLLAPMVNVARPTLRRLLR